MVTRIKKSTPWFLVLILIALSVAIGLNLSKPAVRADDLGTTVSVTNNAPTWTAVPTDSSDSTTPTNVGANVSFAATASDANSEQYYLALCKTNAITPNIDLPPTCTGGNWCISVATNSGSAASCTYTTLTADAESNDWYGFACDKHAGEAGACSTVSTTNMPFKVNHRPRFSYQVNDGPKDPNVTITVKTAGQGETTATNAEIAGANVVVEVGSTTGFAVNDYVWYAGTNPERTQVEAVVAGVSITLDLAYNHAISDAITEIGSEDTDSDTAADTVSLYVCKAADFTGTTCGAGGTWCSQTAQARNPSCSFTTVRPDGATNYYPYIIDNHNFASTDALQGSTQSYTVNNVSPSIAAATIQLLDTDEIGNLTLTTAQGETTGFKVKFTVVDNNSCQNIAAGNEISSAVIHVRMSEILQASCDADLEDNNNNCYANAQTGTGGSCTQDTGTCSGQTDTDAAWTCLFPLQYHADPTVINSQKAAYIWLGAVKATDDDAADTGLVDDDDGTEMGMFLAYDVTEAAIAYGGPLDPGVTSAQQTTTVKAIGNIGLDENLSGTNMTSGANTITVGWQEHSFTTGFTYGTGTDLTVTATEYELNAQKTTTTGSPATKETYWKIQIPSGQSGGSYSGTDTIAGVTGESAGW